MIRLKDAIIGVAVMGAAGLIFILILGFQGSAERARADALQAELAECRAGEYGRADLDSVHVWQNGWLRFVKADSVHVWSHIGTTGWPR